jgi:hypothetical protein
MPLTQKVSSFRQFKQYQEICVSFLNNYDLFCNILVTYLEKIKCLGNCSGLLKLFHVILPDI